MYTMEGQVSMFDVDSEFTKTSAEPSVPMAEKTSELSWKSWQGLSKKESLFLDLRRENGQPRESSSAQIFPSHGGSSMPNIGESHNADEGFVSLLISMDTPLRKSCLARVNTTEAPSEEIVSRLSDILEKNPDPKYNLSAKACQGILNRANRRGKTLPPDASGCLGAGDSERLDLHPCSWDGGQTSPTLTARKASGCQRMPDKENFNAVIQPIAIDMGGGKSSVDIHTDRSPTLTTTHYGEPAVVYDARGNGDGTVAPTMTGDHQNRVTDYTGVVIALDRAPFNQGKNAKYDFEISEDGINSPIVAKGPSALCYGVETSDGDVAGTLDASYYKGCGMRQGVERTFVVKSVDCRNCTEDDVNCSLQSNSAHSLNGNNVVRVKYIVRRLTPLECERLQGFPDGWTDIGEYIDTKGKKCKASDASRYKALGNSIALPSWKFILKRLCSHYERDATMASLFDGIGGFPLLWEQINGKGSCLWASEIEEFPIAVTKERISK